MVVHLFGHPVDMDPVMEIAKKHNLKVIEDCAESHGVEYKGRKVGSIGDIGAFSFFANKTITCGEGGMVVTNSVEIAERAKSLKNLGDIIVLGTAHPYKFSDTIKKAIGKNLDSPEHLKLNMDKKEIFDIINNSKTEVKKYILSKIK